MERITFIGPTYPFKGGLSQYATQFFLELKRRCSSRMVTYRGLYPKRLFPGNSEPDPSQSRATVGDAERSLSFLNPLTFLQLGRALNRDHAQVILTWWTVAWMPHTWLLASQIRDKSRLVFWCHNVVDHDSGALKARLIRGTLALATKFVVHTEPDAKRLRNWFPEASVTVSPLPLLSMPGSEAPPRPAANDVPKLLFFGFVRPYKGLEDLLRALPTVLAKQAVTLTIAGEFWGNTKQETEALIAELKLDAVICVQDRYIPNEELSTVFAAHDLVVMPYRSATGSAVANMAIEYERPIVATRVGSLPSCVEPGANGFLAEAQNPADLAEAIQKAITHDFSPSALRQARESRANGWSQLIDNVLATLRC